MSGFVAMLAVQFGSLFLIGTPAAIVLAARDGTAKLPAWLFLAPAFGLTIYFGLGTLLHDLGLGSRAVYAIVLASTLAALIAAGAARRIRLPLRGLVLGSGLVAAAALLSGAINSVDIASVGLEGYFPLTNDDTFAYLGCIDQIRHAGWLAPIISYPAGFMPKIPGIVLRLPEVIFVADFASTFGLESHAAFFLFQRIALVTIVLAATGAAFIAGESVLAACICFAGLAAGNFILPQVLQQFVGSSSGEVVSIVVLALAAWTARRGRRRGEFLAGAAAAGLAMGIMAMASPEGHPFWLLLLATIFVYLAAVRRQFARLAVALLLFVACYLAVSFPVIWTIWRLIVAQFAYASSKPPGDWVAVPDFVLYASGVSAIKSDVFSAYSYNVQLAALAFAAAFCLAFLSLARRVTRRGASRGAGHSDIFILFASAGIMLLFQAYFYARGMGYGLLKLTDYFAFLPSLVLGVGLSLFARAIGDVRVGTLAALVIAAAGAGYAETTLAEKWQLSKDYVDAIEAMPAPVDYRVMALGRETPAVVVPDLHGEALDLFLYANRWGSNVIWLPPGEFESLRAAASAERRRALDGTAAARRHRRPSARGHHLRRRPEDGHACGSAAAVRPSPPRSRRRLAPAGGH